MSTTTSAKTKPLHAPVVRINYCFSEDGLSRAAIAAHAIEARDLFFWTMGVPRDVVHISSKPGLLQGYNFSLAAYVSTSETSMPATARAAQACLPDLRHRLRTCAAHQAWIEGWVPGRSTEDDMSAIHRIAEGQFVRLAQEQEAYIAKVAMRWNIDPMAEGWTAELLCQEIAKRAEWLDDWVPGCATWDDMNAINRIAVGQFLHLTEEQEAYIAKVAMRWYIDPMAEGWTAELLCKEIAKRAEWLDDWVPGRSTWDDMNAINRIAEGQFLHLTEEQEAFIEQVAILWLVDTTEGVWTSELLCQEICERAVMLDLQPEYGPVQLEELTLPLVNRHDEY